MRYTHIYTIPSAHLGRIISFSFLIFCYVPLVSFRSNPSRSCGLSGVQLWGICLLTGSEDVQGV